MPETLTSRILTVMDDQVLMEEVLEFAIGEEQAAADFYTRLAAQAVIPEVRKAFERFAQEETRHKAKLQAIKLAGMIEPATMQQPVDLRISDYLVEKPPSADMDYHSALNLAIRKEKIAFKLYSDLAATAPNETLRKTFLILAREEADHRLRFEKEEASLPDSSFEK